MISDGSTFEQSARLRVAKANSEDVGRFPRVVLATIGPAPEANRRKPLRPELRSDNAQLSVGDARW